MVEKLDAEERSGRCKTTGQRYVLGRGLGIATRMVVSHNEARSATQDRGLETFARLCCGGSYVA
jgi:hypothetical protein